MRTLAGWTLSWLVLALAACAGDTPEEPLPTLGSIAGSYTLVQVNGEALPWLVRQRPDEIEEITEGDLTLTAGGAYEMRVLQETRSLVPPFVSLSSEYVDAGSHRLVGFGLIFEPLSPDTTHTGRVDDGLVEVRLAGWTPDLPEEMVLTFER